MLTAISLSAQGFAAGPLRSAVSSRTSQANMAVGLIYSTSTGNTETVAG